MFSPQKGSTRDASTSMSSERSAMAEAEGGGLLDDKEGKRTENVAKILGKSVAESTPKPEQVVDPLLIEEDHAEPMAGSSAETKNSKKPSSIKRFFKLPTKKDSYTFDVNEVLLKNEAEANKGNLGLRMSGLSEGSSLYEMRTAATTSASASEQPTTSREALKNRSTFKGTISNYWQKVFGKRGNNIVVNKQPSIAEGDQIREEALQTVADFKFMQDDEEDMDKEDEVVIAVQNLSIVNDDDEDEDDGTAIEPDEQVSVHSANDSNAAATAAVKPLTGPTDV